MASNDTPSMASFGGQFPVRVCKLTLTVATGQTTATATSASKFRGTIEKIEIDPGSAMATSATLKVYQSDTPLATGTRDHYLNYTFPASEVELVVYPMVAAVSNTGGALTTATSTKYVVNGQIKADLASAVAADSVIVYVFVRG